ncbi:MAG TPA: RNA polymerase sigma factor [Candidatus Kapabacteria bacterium]|nr:RNA polymerase sigma factor [Candidatus Kapabacteria bacterium]
MSHFQLTLSSPVNTERNAINTVSALDPSDDVALLESYLFSGDANALVTLYDRHNRRLYMYCLKLLGNAEQAEDLTQEIWERIARLRARPQHVLNPTGFLLRIARNLCLNQLKARRRTSSLDDVHEGALPQTSQHELSELEDVAVRALHSLPDDYREVLILSLYSGYRLDEIATMLEKSPDAIRKRASRARIQLRERVMTLIEKSGVDPATLLSRSDMSDMEASL